MINDFEGLRHIVSERKSYFCKCREKQITMDYSKATMGAIRKEIKIQ